MNRSDLICRDEQRRHKARTILNGLDYVEVSEDQHVLDVHFFQAAPTNLRKENIQITGGTRIPTITVSGIQPCDPAEEDHDERLHIAVESPGDFSIYTLSLVQLDDKGHPTGAPLPGFDPRYSHVRFSFKIACPSDLDCRPQNTCPPPARQEPDIDYLAKDYASFRQLMLDRLSVTLPEWTERHVPDLGIALVEVLAYVGDYLSYHQDAVATEAYLGTARRRTSVRRHARLVDYQLHEGTNARGWIHIHSSDDFTGDQALEPRHVFFISTDGSSSALSRQVLTLDDIRSVPFDRYEVFEPLDQEKKIALHSNQNTIAFHTWGDRQCCLPEGATSATLRDVERPATEPPPPPPGYAAPAYQGKEGPTYAAKGATDAKRDPAKKHAQGSTAYEPSKPPHDEPSYEPPTPPAPPPHVSGLALAVGDYLLFEEVRGPRTGNPADADPLQRHVVRLTRVTPGVDEVEHQPVLDIEWAHEDALPFPLCLSAIVGEGCQPVDVSVARGNLLLVDHGRTIADEPLGVVPRETLAAGCEGALCPGEITVTAGTFGPVLAQGSLVFALRLDRDAAASQQTSPRPDARSATPAIRVVAIPPEPSGLGPLVPYELLTGGDWEKFAATLRASTSPAHQFLRAWLGVRARTRLANNDLDAEALRKAVERLPQDWLYRPDLLGSGGQDRHFTIEVDNDGRGHLRFGDGELGRQPEAGTAFAATYRVGNPTAGNVGAERISHIVFRTGTASGVDLRPRNPLPAVGGTAPETLAEARLFAPHRFRTERLRAITAEDYAHLAGQHPRVQRAAAALQWTGNGYEALVAIDQRHRAEAEPTVLAEVAARLDPFRRIGHSVRTVTARVVPLRLKLTVCVQPSYLRGHVKAAVLDILSNRQLPDGRRGLFHPDGLTFGQSVFVSPIVAMVQAVAGVESVVVDSLEPLFDGPAGEIEAGVLTIGPLEIARLDNDRSLPENGRLELDMRGGR